MLTYTCAHSHSLKIITVNRTACVKLILHFVPYLVYSLTSIYLFVHVHAGILFNVFSAKLTCCYLSMEGQSVKSSISASLTHILTL